MRLQEIPHDLRAALALVLERRKSYAEIAAMLSIERGAVHDRAHAGLALLAPRQARELSASQREQVGEYLLGQTDAARREEARAYLQGSAPARAWARALAAELAPLGAESLPAIPAGSSEIPAGEPEIPAGSAEIRAGEPEILAGSAADDGAGAHARPSGSRRGGAIVLGAIAAIAIVGVVLIVSLGGGSSPSSATGSTAPGGQSGSGAASTTGATSTSTAAGHGSSAAGHGSSATPAASGKSGKASKSGSEPHLDATLPLAPPSSSSKALGLVEVISEGNERAFIVAAEHLPPTSGFRYAAWLYNTPDDAYFLGGGPTVGANGTLKAAGGLPPNASRYATIVLTEERQTRPKQPGPIVLSGPFRLK